MEANQNANQYFSVKPREELLGLFKRVGELDVPDLGYAELLERAERHLVEKEDDIDFRQASRIKISYDEKLPASFKIRINNVGLDAEVDDIIRKQFRITRVQTPFKLKIVLAAYLNYLESSEKEENTKLTILRDENPDDMNDLKIRAITLILSAPADAIKDVISRLGGLD